MNFKYNLEKFCIYAFILLLQIKISFSYPYGFKNNRNFFNQNSIINQNMKM